MDPVGRFLNCKESVLKEGRVGLLCNQVSFHTDSGKYLFEILNARKVLKTVFVPEHGLFAELQDQIPLEKTTIYSDFLYEVDCISLYGNEENTLIVNPEHLKNLDALVVDIQDVGSRYYTFATTLSYIFDVLSANQISIEVYVVDRVNPAGRQVEGTVLPVSYSSFVGRPGILHRHGLTIGELALLYKEQSGGNFSLKIIELSEPEKELLENPLRKGTEDLFSAWHIAPSPNMPSLFTPLLYSGQCLLEGTNLSEGRGTTRPFEIFGAPYLKDPFRIAEDLSFDGAVLRPLFFIPAFHKHKGEICSGFQIHIKQNGYHSLLHTLRMLRYFSENFQEFEFLKGVYEFRSDRPAIELLCGDEDLISYLTGSESYEVIEKKMTEAQYEWVDKKSELLIYSDLPLRNL